MKKSKKKKARFHVAQKGLDHNAPSRQVVQKQPKEAVKKQSSSQKKRLKPESHQPSKQNANKRKRGWFSALSIPKRILVIAACVGAFFYFIYQPVCIWYAATRDGQIYQEEKTLYEQSNAELQARADTLNSDEGEKDEARKHGYAEQGESTVIVEGLPQSDEAKSDEDDSSRVPKDIVQMVLEKPDPFYIQILDFIFLYHKG